MQLAPSSEMRYLTHTINMGQIRMPAPLTVYALTLERLKEVMNYCTDTGQFTWIKKTNSRGINRVGLTAGKVDPNGYTYLRIDKKDYLAQRVAWLYVHGEWPARRLRFLDGNEANFSIANLTERLDKHAPRVERDAYDLRVNPKAFRAADLKRDFGITVEQYHALYQAQAGACAICRQPEKDKRNGVVKWLAIDHCHERNFVRGLLCAACNLSIGRMGENPGRLRAAANYIERGLATSTDADNVIRIFKRGTA